MTEGSKLDKKQGKEKLADVLRESEEISELDILMKSKNSCSKKYLNMQSGKNIGYGQRTECWSY